MIAPELKSCPFCGGADLDRSVLIGGIFCEGCGADGPWSPAFHGDWNTRAAPSLSAALELPEVRALVSAARDALSFLMHDIPLENKSANPERGKLLDALAAIEKGTTP